MISAKLLLVFLLLALCGVSLVSAQWGGYYGGRGCESINVTCLSTMKAAHQSHRSSTLDFQITVVADTEAGAAEDTVDGADAATEDGAVEATGDELITTN